MIAKTLAILLGALALGAIADQAPPVTVTDGLPQRDPVSEFQQLKYQALQLQADVDRARPAAPGSLTIYVGSVASSLKLKHVSISLDDRLVASREVDDTAFHSVLAGDRLARVGSATVAEGPHALHAEFQVTASSAQGATEQTVVMDGSLEGGQGITSISLRLEPSRLVTPARIALQRYRTEASKEGWALKTLHEVGRFGGVDGRYIPGDLGDPAVAYAEYLRNSGQAERAAVELLKLSTGAGEALPPAYWLRTAAVLREVGLSDYSRKICERLDAQHQQSQAVATERLNIALKDYDVGKVAQAEAELQAIGSRVPDDRVQDWQLAYAQILFLHDRYPEAEKVLQDRDKEGTEAFRYMSHSEKALLTTAFRRYNLAVAMVHNGEEKKGLSLLDLIGRLKTLDKDLAAVRDQANLTLGWYFLRKKQGITAMGALGRVGMGGRWSEPALLGMGWAQLAPAGEKIKRVRLDHEPGNTLAPLPAPLKHSLTELGVFDPELDGNGGPASFERGDPPQDRTEGLKRALLFWRILAKRDPNDPAVQEGMLAIAYAYDNLDDKLGAQRAYVQAIASLEARKKGLAAEAGSIQAQGLSALADRSPDSKGTAALMGDGYLVPNEQTREVFGALDRYRDLAATLDALNAMDSSNTEQAMAPELASRAQALRDEIIVARQEELKDMQAQALQDIDRQEGQTDQYLQAAYFAAARTSDQTLAFDGR
ncbi:hypothetical protein [Nevskia soli]|uniref:hypothetical protein n=1 Tax=Nevskia soli TaxID=418856 RepID=UPI0012F9E38E|nr:hypothetical protein [Nevskia soli]